MPGSPLQPQAGVLLLFGFVVGLVKIHQGYCLRHPSRQKPKSLPPFRKLISRITLSQRVQFDSAQRMQIQNLIRRKEFANCPRYRRLTGIHSRQPIHSSVRAYKHFAGLVQAFFIGLLFCCPILAASQEAVGWTNARMALASATNFQPSEISVDMAPFARVLSWDPNRKEGVNPSHTNEVLAKKLIPEKVLPRQADGTFLVPSYKKRLACVGLQWDAPRSLKEIHLEFTYPGQMPQLRNIQVEGWFGKSAAQGKWKKLDGTFKRTGNRVTFYLNSQNKEDTILTIQKIRWIFLCYSRVIELREISAFTQSQWDTMDILIEAEKPLTKSKGTIEVVNGTFIGLSETNWNFKHPIHLKVCYSHGSSLNSDPTILQFKLPTGSFEVAMEQLKTNECVYLPAHALFIARESAGIDLAAYRKGIDNGKMPSKRGSEPSADH
jgi:hypothetical protein